MVRISEDLVRKRAEHNESEISSLEELSLHQQDIGSIEYLDKWCRELKILYLQSNLICKIENVGRLKKLEYLNLALNNVEKIENLEACESLQKLDLTVNFIGELTSIQCLKELTHFRDLYLCGNPCAEYDGYRRYVIAELTQLQTLDGIAIERSERIVAVQDYSVLKEKIIEQQTEYAKLRKKQIEDEKIRKEKRQIRKQRGPGYDGKWYTDINNENCNGDISQSLDGDDKSFWDEKVPYTPESRREIYEHLEEDRKKSQSNDEKPVKAPRRLFDNQGRPFNINEAKLEFSFEDDIDNNLYVLDLACYKHLDTALLDLDVMTNYVRVTIKEKIFQLRFEHEVKPDSSTAKRSQVTGHLLFTVPKANSILKTSISQNNQHIPQKTETSNRPKTEKLEVDQNATKTVNYTNIVDSNKTQPTRPFGCKSSKNIREKQNSPHFIDDPDVPPLI